MQLTHCSTDKMIADFLTKPLQGALFRKLREVLMGRASVESLDIPKAPTPQERVEENTRKDVKAPSKDPPITSERTKPTYASMLRSRKSLD